jgi:hypothetical protein
MTNKYFGTDPHLLTRTDDPDTSHEAGEGVDTTRLEEMVYNAIYSYGDEGCHADQLLAKFNGFPYSSITARFAALERKSHIYYRGDKRKGRSGRNQRVMRAERRSAKREEFRLTGE